MVEKIVIKAQTRKILGKKVKQLRSQGLLPASVYGGGESTSIEIPALEFAKIYKETGDKTLLYIKVEGEKKERPVLIEEIQADSTDSRLLHVGFKQVSLKEKVKTEIPLEIIGEFSVPDSNLITVQDIVEVEALPTDLPESFKIDVSTLEKVGDSITLGDLDVDLSKVELMLGDEGLDLSLVIVQEQKEEVEEVEEVAVEEGEEGASEEKEDESKEDDKSAEKESDKKPQENEGKK